MELDMAQPAEAAASIADPPAAVTEAKLLARRVAAARQLGASLQPFLGHGTRAPRQTRWEAPLRNRCWNRRR